MKMRINRLIILCLVIFLFYNCKNQKFIKITILPNYENDFMCQLITFYAKDYDSKKGILIISEENLILLEQQIKTCIETGLYNINNYHECKEKNIDYLYSFFEIYHGDIIYKQEESYRYIYDPKNERAIKAGSETGYVKFPDLDIRNELLLLINYNSAYKEFGMALMNANKSFFIDLNYYEFEINSYFQKYF